MTWQTLLDYDNEPSPINPILENKMKAYIAAIEFDGESYVYLSYGYNYDPSFYTDISKPIDAKEICTKEFSPRLEALLDDVTPSMIDLLYLILPDGLATEHAMQVLRSDSLPLLRGLNRSEAILAEVHLFNETDQVEGIALDISYDCTNLWEYCEDEIKRISSNDCTLNQFSTRNLVLRLIEESNGEITSVMDSCERKLINALRVLNNPELRDDVNDDRYSEKFVRDFCQREAQKLNDEITSKYGNKLKQAQQICLFGSGARILAPWLLSDFGLDPVQETAAQECLSRAAIFSRLDFSDNIYQCYSPRKIYDQWIRN